MDFRLDTYCGLYCGACDILLANKKGSADELAQAWNMKSEDVRCHGCKSKYNAIYCRDCFMKQCAEGKTIEYCCECDDYPCNRLVSFRNDKHAHHSIILHNLDYIKKHGSVKWLDEQRARWSCPGCGSEFSFYDSVCGVCGERVNSCRDEEKNIADLQTGG